MIRRKICKICLLTIPLVLLSAALPAPTEASAKKKTTKAKRKVVANAKPSSGAAARNFSCVGTPNQQVAGRIVSGTVAKVGGKPVVTNVTVSKTFELVDNTIVPTNKVDLTAPNPPGELDPIGEELVVFRLNTAPQATAADVDRLLSIYQFNFPTEIPAGPKFTAGLYFNTLKGVAGPATNEYRWSMISSLAYGGAYSMNCEYI
jgi:hypothetical protein